MGITQFALSLLFLASSLAHGAVLVSKELQEDYIVRNRNSSVKVTIYNLGPDTITDVDVVDKTFSNSSQFIIHGFASTFFKEVDVARNATFSYNVVPLIYGSFTDEPAVVLYHVDDAPVVAFSSAMGALYIATEQEYAMVSSHRNDWLVFTGLALLPVIIPYYFYSTTVSQLAITPKKSQ
ncbi:hypothetical protein SeMB42_g00089 [Synchytrium endobioticum]|uniref:Translocon-associated protein subunit beta n=1 Tax=Synchytrium endobioticum TaxID=286115 RepID=A0A507DIV2_9FUNG|nr:hypothetical protein SeLEV6574_g00181 [Synchytrium endobioticum]TPX54890.1 hypothetical protein SeMB42_g00089 [Synchytrium endobioticum]